MISAYHQVQLPVDLSSDEEFPSHVGLFEPKADFAEDHCGFMVAPCVSYLRRKNYTTVDKPSTCPIHQQTRRLPFHQ